MNKLITLVAICCFTACKSQVEKSKATSFDNSLLNVIKERNFIINDIDFIITLPEIEYLSKNDRSIEKNWEEFKNYYKKNYKIHRELSISSSYMKSYLLDKKLSYLSSQLSFLEITNDTDEENINYIFFDAPKEEIIGFDEISYMDFAFYLKDKFFEIVEKDNHLQEVYKSMLEDNKFILYLVLFDTSLCEVDDFKHRKIKFLRNHFKDCKSKYGKMLYKELLLVDINREY